MDLREAQRISGLRINLVPAWVAGYNAGRKGRHDLTSKYQGPWLDAWWAGYNYGSKGV